MGDVIPFRKRTTLEFPMVFNAQGIGINPKLLKRIHVTKQNVLYFVFDSDEYETPSTAFITPSAIDACTSAVYLRELLVKDYGIDVEILYDKD